MRTDRQIAEEVFEKIVGAQLRRNGKTTRIIDELVQDFFNTGIAICRDHYDSPQRHKEVMVGLLKRITAEHGCPYSSHSEYNLVINIKHPNHKEALADAINKCHNNEIPILKSND